MKLFKEFTYRVGKYLDVVGPGYLLKWDYSRTTLNKYETLGYIRHINDHHYCVTQKGIDAWREWRKPMDEKRARYRQNGIMI